MTIIMILTNSFSPDVRVYKEAKYLVSKGNNVIILCWDKSPQRQLPSEENVDGIKIIRFKIPAIAGTGIRQLRSYFSFVKHCKKHLADNKCDYLHCHDLDGAIAGCLARYKKTPLVFDMHEFYEKGIAAKRLAIRFMVKSLVRRSVAVIYVSKTSFEKYSFKFKDKFFVLRNYCDSNFFYDNQKYHSHTFRVSYIGEVRNQIPEFIALFEAVRELKHVRVDIYGGGVDYEKLKSLQKKYSNVKVHGWYNGVTESMELYKNTDVSFIAYNPNTPNYKGDFEPVKIYEAIFTGTPIIATKGIYPGRLAESEGFGISVDTKDCNSIRDAIIKLSKNESFYTQCIKNMKNKSRFFDWNNAVTILDKIYG